MSVCTLFSGVTGTKRWSTSPEALPSGNSASNREGKRV